MAIVSLDTPWPRRSCSFSNHAIYLQFKIIQHSLSCIWLYAKVQTYNNISYTTNNIDCSCLIILPYIDFGDR